VNRSWRWAWGVAWLLALAAAAGPAHAQFAARASITPGRVRLAEPVVYRGVVHVPRALTVRWVAPDTGGALTWGPLAASRARDTRARPASALIDTLRVEAALQAFALGAVPVPGLRFVTSTPAGPVVHRLPVVTLQVAAVIPARDAHPQLRPVRGPLAAPWWERVPWRWVALGVLLLAALVLFVWWLRRRRRLVRAAAPARAALDPAAEALAALAALRGLQLPEQGRFGEHAFHLTRIVRQFLERTQGTPRPGDTTRELVARLGGSALTVAEVAELGALLQAFDLVKFARARSSVEQARRAEAGVEGLVRRHAAPAAGEQAA
jgi:hypothetical protein